MQSARDVSNLMDHGTTAWPGTGSQGGEEKAKQGRLETKYRTLGGEKAMRIYKTPCKPLIIKGVIFQIKLPCISFIRRPLSHFCLPRAWFQPLAATPKRANPNCRASPGWFTISWSIRQS